MRAGCVVGAVALLAGAPAFGTLRLDDGKRVSGTSLCTPELQREIVRTLAFVERLAASRCPDPRLGSARIVERTFAPLMWKESWSVSRCGRTVDYEVRLVPHDRGTHVEIAGPDLGSRVVARDPNGTLASFDPGRAGASKLIRRHRNLLENGGFERGGPKPDGWILAGGSFSLEPGREGGRALVVRVSRDEEAEGDPPKVSASQPVAAVRGGDTVALMGWIKAEGVEAGPDGNTASIQMENVFGEGDGAWTDWPNTGRVGGSRDWAFFRLDKTLNADLASSRVYVTMEQSTGTVWFDDIVLTLTHKTILKVDRWFDGWAPPEPAAGDDQNYHSLNLKLELLPVAATAPVPGGIATYRLVPRGLPGDDRVVVWARRMDRTAAPLGFLGVFSERADARWVSDSGIPLDSVRLHVDDALPGEPLEAALVSETYKGDAYARAVPRPLEARGEGACRAWAVLDGLDGKRFTLRGTGFAEGEEVDLRIDGGGPPAWRTVTASAGGGFVVAIEAGNAGPGGGVVGIAVRSGECRLDLAVPWGSRLYPSGAVP